MGSKGSPKGREFRSMLAASSIGLVFVFSIVIGTLIGVWLDGKLGTRPYLTVFFLFIGIAAGIKNAYFFIKKSGAMEKIEPAEPDTNKKDKNERR